MSTPPALLHRARRGDPVAREALVREHADLVRQLCRRMDPEPDDAVQETWAHLLAHLDRIDPDHPGGLGGWIRTVVRRLLVDRHRRRRTRGRVQTDPEADGIVPIPTARLEARQRLDHVRRALASLPDPWRRVVQAHHLEGRPLADIAHDEGVAIGTVKSRLHRARAQLLTLLDDGDAP